MRKKLFKKFIIKVKLGKEKLYDFLYFLCFPSKIFVWLINQLLFLIQWKPQRAQTWGKCANKYALIHFFIDLRWDFWSFSVQLNFFSANKIIHIPFLKLNDFLVLKVYWNSKKIDFLTLMKFNCKLYKNSEYWLRIWQEKLTISHHLCNESPRKDFRINKWMHSW